jgi:hypothetical protein
MGDAGRTAQGTSAEVRRIRCPTGRAVPRSRGRALAGGSTGWRVGAERLETLDLGHHIVGFKVQMHAVLEDVEKVITAVRDDP